MVCEPRDETGQVAHHNSDEHSANVDDEELEECIEYVVPLVCHHADVAPAGFGNIYFTAAVFSYPL